MLQENGESPEDDDPPYASARDYYEIARKNRTRPSNKYVSDIEHKMTIMTPNLAKHFKIFRVESAELILVDSLSVQSPSFMARPGTYVIEPSRPHLNKSQF